MTEKTKNCRDCLHIVIEEWEFPCHCCVDGSCYVHSKAQRPDSLRESIPVESPDLHKPGAKDDKEKTQFLIILEAFPLALEEVAHVAMMGAKKYTRGGWKSVPNGRMRYTDAMIRHLMAECRGESCDKESRLHHAAHLAWNALARLEFILKGEGEPT